MTKQREMEKQALELAMLKQEQAKILNEMRTRQSRHTTQTVTGEVREKTGLLAILLAILGFIIDLILSLATG